MSLLSGLAAAASTVKHGISFVDGKQISYKKIQEPLLEARQNLQRAALNPRTSAADLRERIIEFNAFCRAARIPNAERIGKIDSLMKLHFGIVTKEQAKCMLRKAESDEWARQAELANILAPFSKPDIVDAVMGILGTGDFFLSVAENPSTLLGPDHEVIHAAYKGKLSDLQGHISSDCLRGLTARMRKMEHTVGILTSFNIASWNLCKAFREDKLAYEPVLEEYNKISSPEHEQSRELIQRSQALRDAYLALIGAPCFQHRKTNLASNQYDDAVLKKIEGAIQKAEYHLATKDMLAQVRAEEAEYLRLREECNRNQNPKLELCIELHIRANALIMTYLALTEIPCFRPNGKTAGDVLFLRQIERTQNHIEAYFKNIIRSSSQKLADYLAEKHRGIRAKKKEVALTLSQVEKQMELLAPFITSSENQGLAELFNLLVGLHAQVTVYIQEALTLISQIKDLLPSTLLS